MHVDGCCGDIALSAVQLINTGLGYGQNQEARLKARHDRQTILIVNLLWLLKFLFGSEYSKSPAAVPHSSYTQLLLHRMLDSLA